MFAITSAVKKWCHYYLLGRHFRVYTDQQSLRGMVNQVIQTPTQQKWLAKLVGFNFEILYTPGKDNLVTDALSRISEPPELLFLAATTCHPLFLDQLRQFYQDHSLGQQIIRKGMGEIDSNFTAATLAPIFLSDINRLHDMLRTIVSDHERVFGAHSGANSLASKERLYPSTDVQTKVTNRTLETFLHCFVCDSPGNGVQYFPLAEYWYNTTYHSVIKMSPFVALYYHSPPSLWSYIASSKVVTALDSTLSQRHSQLQVIKDNLAAAQISMCNQANTHRQDRSFKVYAWVWLGHQPFCQTTLRDRCSSKLSKHFYGPFQILK